MERFKKELKEDILILIKQIIPDAHPQQQNEMAVAMMAALTGEHPTLDGQYSDAGCCLISNLAGNRNSFFK